MIYIASDHAGFRLKKEIKNYLDELGIKYQDLGASKLNPKDDYPDFTFRVAEKVAENPRKDKGIVICGTGQGVVLAANKVKSIRAASAWDKYTAEMAKAHLNANILALGGRITPVDTAKEIVSEWLSTAFSGEERHKRRLKKIEKFKRIEKCK